MKALSTTLLSFLLIGQVIGQAPGSNQVEGQMADEFFEYAAVSERNIFYTNNQKQYVFKVGEGPNSTRLVLEAGDSTLFNLSDGVHAPNNIHENENIVHFYLPPIKGGEILPLLPAMVDHEIFLGLMMKKEDPSIDFNVQEKSCAEFVHQYSNPENETDSVMLCFYNAYEEAYLELFDREKRLCFRNHTVWSDSSGEYRLDHWFDPEEFGFVKFMFTLPDGDVMKIELVEVNES